MPSHLQEGLTAYAAEMADIEDRRRISWAFTWASIRERAQTVLRRILNDKEDKLEEGFAVPKLTVEIDIEDEQDFFDDLSDAE